MKRLPQITDAEWLVMQVLWSSPNLTADELIDQLKDEVTWNGSTIRTLINRLLKKKALKYTMEGRKYRYRPAVSEQECARQERRTFVQRVYGGTVTPMLAAFIDEAELSEGEIKELKRMLDQKRKE